MRKATIYYNVTPHPMENKYWAKKSLEISFGEESNTVNLKKGFFTRYWRIMPIKEEVDEFNLMQSLEDVYAKYNNYDANPYSAQNGGQQVLKEIGVNHTSMMVGDVIKVGEEYYVVSGFGFKKLILT